MNGQLDANAMARLNEAMAKSKKIMEMDSTVSRMAASKRDSINSSIEGGEPMVIESKTMDSMQQPKQRMRMNESTSSKLPREILESFKKDPMDPMDQTMELPKELFEAQVIEAPRVEPRQTITESVHQPTVQQPIDYSMIRMIVEESVRKHVSALSKKMLIESKETDALDAMISTNGGFKFLTKNGDIYEAKLVKKGNIKDRT